MSLSRLELLTFRLSNEHSTIESQALKTWSRRDRTFEWWIQRPLPYHLAILQKNVRSSYVCAGEEGIEPPPPSLKPGILAVELFPRV